VTSESDSAPGQQDDTVAQRPSDTQAGTPVTPPAIGADLDQENPTLGAQPPFEEDAATMTERPKMAAGLPAIYETTRFAVGEMGLARGAKALLKMNQKDGFDCQSCAWPSPDEHRQVAEFCENGAKALADEGTTKRLTPEFFREHSLDDLRQRSDFWLGQQGRLTQPMVKRAGATHYEAIAWDDAFKLIAAELNALPTPNAAAFYTSGRTSNEAA
jgi:anaerobic selenocysteine-containing dehydrogenase